MPEIVTDIEPLDDLREEWSALLASSSANNLFLTWEWISSWCTYMRHETETPLIITAREEGRLVGIAPIMCEKHRFLGDYYHIIGQRYSYHLGFVSEKGKEGEVYSALLTHLFNTVGKKLFVLDFKHLDVITAFETALKSIINRKGYYFERRTENPCRVLNLPEKFEEYLESGISSDNLRLNLKKDLKKLSTEHDFQCFDAEQTEFKTYWQELLTLHREEMRRQVRNSVLSKSDFSTHIENSCEMFKDNQSVRLAVIKVNGVIASVLLGIIYNEVFNAITIGLNSDLKKKYPWANISVLSHTFAIKTAIESGCREFDFLGGDHDFKKKMGGKEKGGIRIIVYRSRFHKIIENVLSRFAVLLLRKAK